MRPTLNQAGINRQLTIIEESEEETKSQVSTLSRASMTSVNPFSDIPTEEVQVEKECNVEPSPVARTES